MRLGVFITMYMYISVSETSWNTCDNNIMLGKLVVGLRGMEERKLRSNTNMCIM